MSISEDVDNQELNENSPPSGHIKLHKMNNILIGESFDGNRHHLSISLSNRLPSWHEVKKVREKFCCPDRFYAIVLPPSRYYVNLHEFCFHLWEVRSPEEIEIWSGM